MSVNYVIKRSDGTVYATLPPDVILGPNQPNQNPVPLNLVGRNRVGYGQATNENFLWLTENFSGQVSPKGSVKGQLWYKNANSAGELLISLVDNARQPDNTKPETEKDWATIPMITIFNTVPDGTNSIMGRMVLTNNGDSLKVLMKNKEWREIQTTRPINKEYNTLLDINYDPNVKYIQFTQSASSKYIAYFNSGGIAETSSDGWTTLGNGEGVLQFGSNYYYEMKILGRLVKTETDGSITSIPTNYKTWLVKGSFYVDNKGVIVPGVATASQIPDPRKLVTITKIIDTIDQSNTSTWSVDVEANTADPSLPNPNGTTKADYENYVMASLNSSKHYGFRVKATISGLGTGQNALTQWSVAYFSCGVPPIGV